MFRTHQELIGVRRRHAWLTGARTRVDHVANEQLAFTSRAGDGVVTVLLNIAGSEHRFPAVEPGEILAPAGSAGDPWLVPACSWRLVGR